MLPDIERLLEIQELDKEEIELNQQLARYPLIWEDVKSRLAKRKQDAERAEKNKERHFKERKRIEQKIRIYSEDLRRFQAQQSSVRTNREAEALRKQVDVTKEKISQLEEQGLALLNKDEQVERDVVESAQELSKAEEFYRSEKGRIREQFNEKKASIAELKSAREKLVPHVSEQIYAIYDKVSRQHPGSAIVPVRSESCSGCHYGLLKNVLVELHRGETVVICPNCGRILAYDEDYVPEEHSATG